METLVVIPAVCKPGRFHVEIYAEIVVRILAGIPWQIGQQSQQGTQRDMADMAESAVYESGLFREFLAFVNDTPPP